MCIYGTTERVRATRRLVKAVGPAVVARTARKASAQERYVRAMVKKNGAWLADAKAELLRLAAAGKRRPAYNTELGMVLAMLTE